MEGREDQANFMSGRKPVIGTADVIWWPNALHQARGDLSFTRLLTDLYRPASIFQATSILISPSINVLGEEKFSTSCFVETQGIVHPWEFALSVFILNLYI